MMIFIEGVGMTGVLTANISSEAWSIWRFVVSVKTLLLCDRKAYSSVF